MERAAASNSAIVVLSPSEGMTMTVSTRSLGIKLSFVLLFLTASCCGCIKGDVFELVHYDPATDDFRYLQLDLNIAGDSPADLTHLVELWDQRQRIIVHPAFFRLWSLPAILRIDAGHYKVIDLAQADATENPVLETAIPLDTIKVHPGKFFLTKDSTLAYYNEVTVSGKVLDEVLAAWNREIFGQSLIEAIDKELKRRVAGGKSPSWADIREQLVKELRAEEKKGAGSGSGAKAAHASTGSSNVDNQEGGPFDSVSLRSLRNAIAAGEMDIRRHGAQLELAMPLSANDCRELKETIDLWNRDAPQRFKAKPGDYFTSLKGVLRAENDSDQRLVVTVDLPAILNLQQDSYTEAKPNPKLATCYSDTIAGLRSRSIPIDDKLTPKQIVDAFTAKQP
jgi:hypothetical protein